jgi:hypothetical protein
VKTTVTTGGLVGGHTASYVAFVRLAPAEIDTVLLGDELGALVADVVGELLGGDVGLE